MESDIRDERLIESLAQGRTFRDAVLASQSDVKTLSRQDLDERMSRKMTDIERAYLLDRVRDTFPADQLDTDNVRAELNRAKAEFASCVTLADVEKLHLAKLKSPPLPAISPTTSTMSTSDFLQISRRLRAEALQAKTTMQ
jgi:hypothetical protein